LLEPRRRIDRALLAVVMEAYVHGTSTRKVDDLVKALGVDSGISKSEVSRICGELDAEVARFRSRSLAHTSFPYVFLDATYLKARVDGRVVSRAVVIATGVTADGGRKSWAWTSVTAAPSGPRSCARSRPVGWLGCSWSSPTPTPG
jgi:transposase-like protein